MRTIITGSRTIEEYALVEQAIAESNFTITTILSGGARGVDALGELYAEIHGIPLERYLADWLNNGNMAGYLRNTEMADRAQALIAVTNGSPGTRNMINIARRRGLKVYVKTNSPQRVIEYSMEEID